MQWTYEVESEQFESRLKQYLKKLAEERDFTPIHELGISNELVKSTDQYRIAEIKLPWMVKTLTIDEFVSENITFNQKVRMKVLYGLSRTRTERRVPPGEDFVYSKNAWTVQRIESSILGTLFELEISPGSDNSMLFTLVAVHEHLDGFYDEFKDFIEWNWNAVLIKSNKAGSEELLSIDDELQTRKTAGHKGYACNVWIDHLVNVRGKPQGGNSDENEFFQMWKRLYKFETGKNPNDPGQLADPWESYKEAIRTGPNSPRNPKK